MKYFSLSLDPGLTPFGMIYNGRDGGSISASAYGLNISSQAQCASACDNMPPCMGYDYDQSTAPSAACYLSLNPINIVPAVTFIHSDVGTNMTGSK